MDLPRCSESLLAVPAWGRAAPSTHERSHPDNAILCVACFLQSFPPGPKRICPRVDRCRDILSLLLNGQDSSSSRSTVTEFRVDEKLKIQNSFPWTSIPSSILIIKQLSSMYDIRSFFQLRYAERPPSVHKCMLASQAAENPCTEIDHKTAKVKHLFSSRLEPSATLTGTKGCAHTNFHRSF